jgi:1-deoxy-D-xylulose-5-phosphate reductoisomerase
MLIPSAALRSESKPNRPLRVAIFGSTGSIGKSALEVVAENPRQFEVAALIAHKNAELLYAQAKAFHPRYVGLVDEPAAKQFAALGQIDGWELVAGEEAVADLAALPEVDVVLAAVVGAAGLRSVHRALAAGKTIALANKESLVAAGSLVVQLQKKTGAKVIPVDSEHSAIFQALQGQLRGSIEGLTLTASGGPFLKRPLADFKKVTREEAVRHPRWSMGAKISVDSATMMNKALELIEAHWLFGVAPAKIDVVVHPQSIIHSLVRFVDGSQIAQLSVPDMKGPISYALAYPFSRIAHAVAELDLRKIGSLEFSALDQEKFPGVSLARECVAQGGGAAMVLNVANEVAVEAFLAGRLSFDKINEFCRKSVEESERRVAQSFEELYGEISELTSVLRARIDN